MAELLLCNNLWLLVIYVMSIGHGPCKSECNLVQIFEGIYQVFVVIARVNNSSTIINSW